MIVNLRGRVPAIAFLSVLALSACTPGTDTEAAEGSGDGELTIWSSFGGAQGELIADYTNEFKAENPDANVSLIEMATPDLKQKVQAAILSGDLPDVIQYYGRSNMEPLVTSNSLTPLDDYIADNADWEAGLVPGWDANYTFDDEVFGVPVEAPLVQLFFNTELLEQAGISTPPATFDELLQAVSALQEGGTIPVTVAGKDGWPVQEWYTYLAMRNGGASAFYDAVAGDVEWNSEPFVTAAEQLKQLVDAGMFQEGYLGDGYDQQLADFVDGQAAMTLTGTWFLGNLTAAEGNILDKTDYVDFPTVPGGAGSITEVQGGPNASFSITSNVDDPDVAWEYIKGLTSTETATKVAVGANALVPNQIEYDESSSPKIFNDLTAALPNYTDYNLFWNEVFSPEQNTQYMNLQNSMLTGDISPQQMMDQFAEYMASDG